MYKKIKSGVYYATETSPSIDQKTINFLEDECRKNNLFISRLCLHENTNSNLMSMLIVIINKFVYPPHKHIWKDEIYTLIKGEAFYEEYDDHGFIVLSKKMTSGTSLLNNSKKFHTIKPTSNVIAFMENTNGPFIENNIEYLGEYT